MKFCTKQLKEITQGTLLVANNLSSVYKISTDTRTINSENVFLPIIGERFDGHDFFDKALAKGCKCGFVAKSAKHKITQDIKDAFDVLIEVNDTLEAYLKLASYYRQKVNPFVISITGSSGKTTTKEMIYSVFAQNFKTHKSLLNHNNEIGLCQTLLNMSEATEYLVLEMGMRGLGEIELLSKYAQPDISIITNIGTAHIGRLKTVENIAKAKCEIIKYAKENAYLIYRNADPVRNTIESWGGNFLPVDDYEILNMEKDKTIFRYKDNTYQIPTGGEYNVQNVLFAIEAGLICGLTPDQINNGLKNYQTVGRRWKEFDYKNNIKLINDAYNANPDSMKAAIKAVIDIHKGKNVQLVLGDMAELGENADEYHASIGEFINNLPVSDVITIGDKAKLITDCIKNEKIKTNSFNQHIMIVKYLKENLKDNTVVLFKASRSMQLEKIIDEL